MSLTRASVATTQALVEDHVSLAMSIAHRMSHRQNDREDVEQVALVGLVKAAQRYDESHGVQFTTFAWRTIEGEIKRFFRDTSWSVHVGRTLQERLLEVMATVGVMTQRLGRSPTFQEIAREVDCSVEEVIEALELQRTRQAVSIDAPVGNDDDGGYTSELPDGIDAIEGADNRHWISHLLHRLPAREREIVRMRFWEQLTQAEIAIRLDISQMHVSRLLARSLAVLREGESVNA